MSIEQQFKKLEVNSTDYDMANFARQNIPILIDHLKRAKIRNKMIKETFQEVMDMIHRLPMCADEFLGQELYDQVEEVIN